MQEEWRPVVGYEGFYEVSNIGNVKSIKRNGTNGKMLSKIKDKDGYLICCLMVKKRTNKKIHRLVAQAFIENTHNKSCVNHINNIRDDNTVSNLEWVTIAENNKHAQKQGRVRKSKRFYYQGEHHEVQSSDCGDDDSVCASGTR